ncbi:MAG: NfeD family protein [Bacteroidales bacterium]|nr:NfeD family protein [Bacteroidales bacterium]
MTYIAIILLILIGIILILLEFLVVPGTTIAGIGGLLLMGSGVYLSYTTYGTQVGHYILLGTFLFIIISFYFSLKTKTWKKMMLNSKIDSKVDNISGKDIKPGDFGKTITRLAPIGKAIVNGSYYEAKSIDKFIDENTDIKVIKIVGNQIIVKLKN